jgi:hypothetical protein
MTSRFLKVSVLLYSSMFAYVSLRVSLSFPQIVPRVYMFLAISLWLLSSYYVSSSELWFEHSRVCSLWENIFLSALIPSLAPNCFSTIQHHLRARRGLRHVHNAVSAPVSHSPHHGSPKTQSPSPTTPASPEQLRVLDCRAVLFTIAEMYVFIRQCLWSMLYTVDPNSSYTPSMVAN